MGYIAIAIVVLIIYCFVTYPLVAWGLVGLTGAWLVWLQSRRSKAAAALAARVLQFHSEGFAKPVEVVGESYRQGALRALAGTLTIDGPTDRFHVAQLVLEPTNPTDRNAVRVQIGGALVGYLEKANAAAYQPVLSRAIQAGRIPVVRATLTGGWVRDDGSPATIGVQLHMGSPAEIDEEISRALSQGSAT